MSERVTYFDLDNNQTMTTLLNQEQTTSFVSDGLGLLSTLGTNACCDRLDSAQSVFEKLTSACSSPPTEVGTLSPTPIDNAFTYGYEAPYSAGCDGEYGHGYQADYTIGYGSAYHAGYGSAYPAGYGTVYPASYGSAYPAGYGTVHPASYGSAYPAGNGSVYPSGYEAVYPTDYETVSSPLVVNNANFVSHPPSHGAYPQSQFGPIHSYQQFMTGYEADLPSDLEPKPCATNSKSLLAESLNIAQDQLFLSGIPNLRSCDNTDMTVATSDGSKKEKRMFCFYCKRFYAKLPRHMEKIHKNETEVKKLVGLPIGSEERSKILARLRNKGMFEHNGNSDYNKKKLLTCRRPNAKYKKTGEDFTSCPGCFGCYAITGVRHHVKKCTNNVLKGERSVLLLGRLVESRIHDLACEKLSKAIFPKMKLDSVVKLIRFDWLIIAHGNKLCVKFTPHYQQDLIRANLRLAGRLLMSVQQLCSDIGDFAAIFQPKYYKTLVDAIRNVGRFDSITNYFGAPSTAAACVTQIREVADLLITEYIMQENVEMQTKTENFLKVFNSDVGIAINRAVFITQAKMRRDRRELLPTTDDIKLLVAYLNRERKTALDHLTQEFTYANWLSLSEFTMASIIVFNRRRIGETQNILVTDFLRREYLDQQTYAKLPEHEKKAAKKYSRMKIRGKKGRAVPVLLRPEITKCIELITRHRCDADVPTENEFLFGLPSSVARGIRVIDAGRLLRKFSVLCGAKEPQTLRGTKLRKHMATTCISLELKDQAVADIAEFMGHHEKIHRDYYRHNPLAREIVKMSKLLEIAQGNDDDDDDDDDEDDDENQEDDDFDFLKEIPSTCADFENSLKPAAEEIAKPARVEKPKRADGKSTKTTKKWNKWTDKEKDAANKVFAEFFKQQKLPSFECIKRLQKRPSAAALNSRTHKEIKSWISNQVQKTRKQNMLGIAGC